MNPTPLRLTLAKVLRGLYPHHSSHSWQIYKGVEGNTHYANALNLTARVSCTKLNVEHGAAQFMQTTLLGHVLQANNSRYSRYCKLYYSH